MDILTAAGLALSEIADPARLLILFLGVLVGLVVGLVPGIGGLTALAVLIPFTFSMDPFSAMALLIGMAAVVPMSDVIPAVFFGVPGTVGCAATVLDGHPLAKKGQAARALGASYSASTLGGLFGAVLLAVSIPILRPVMLSLGTPELLGFCIFGLSMVAALSGGQPLRGMTAGGLGLLIAMVGVDPQAGIERWTAGSLYLWDGLPIAPFTLGLFAVPELAALMIARTQISQSAGDRGFSLSGQARGLTDVLRNWWLMLRCSWIGAALGAVPGMGASVIDWIAYGHAARTEKNTETFGTGDIRGVIASESSNNAREGGALIPTIAFGVPGSASMALLLGAFQIHGLVPGPDMLTRDLDVTYVIIGSLVIGTIVGALICVFASGYLVKLVDIRYSILLPIVLGLALVGAYVGGQHAWADMVVVIGAGLLGWLMRELGWPRAPLILGLVLGDLVERYLFISIQLYDFAWVFRPVVLLMLALAAYGLYRPMRNLVAGTIAALRQRGTGLTFGRQAWFSLGFILVLVAALVISHDWPWRARIAPQSVAIAALLFAVANLVVEVMRGRVYGTAQAGLGPSGTANNPAEAALPDSVVYGRGLVYFLWLAGVVATAWLIGLLPTLFGYGIAFARVEGREKWRTAIVLGTGLAIGCWLLFDQLLGVIWPRSVLGGAFPDIRHALGGVL
ncbi:tripartite tricarboxylate transporter permease [Bauldia sp.]|uniref:tripartite tricarboxylate transporter permease n=1 Tax=Bauldia sp. TaxID=2575872 RepID=UPI003BAB33AE